VAAGHDAAAVTLTYSRGGLLRKEGGGVIAAYLLFLALLLVL